MLTQRPEKWRVTIETLSPLHIGTGDILRRDYDFAVHEGKTWVVNDDKVAEMLYGDPVFDTLVAGARLSDLLSNDDYHSDSGLFRYVMDGEPAAQSANAEVREQIKDVWDQPYIPGSSLKGALRTALFYALFEVTKMTWALEGLGRTAKGAGDILEQRALGQSPNTDLLRALQVSDSTGDDMRRLRVLNMIATKTADGGDDAAPITLEAVPTGITFTSSITLDAYLLSQAKHPDLNWSDQQTRWLQRLPKAVTAWTTRRILAEENRPRTDEWDRQFKSIAKRLDNLEPMQCILQLGWGGGWDSKTLGDHLTQRQGEFKRLVDTYRMIRKGEFKQGERFPKTRRVFRSGKSQRIRGELGWVLLTWEKVE
jgi:CRISPR-associated protein Csm5